MFHLEGIVFIAVLCVANAAVTFKVYDKELTMNDGGNKISTCINDNCNRFCHSIGYNHGVCDGDTCICSNTQQKDDNSIEDNPVDLKELNSCNNQDCDRNCRQRGFISGMCFSGRCICRILRNVEAHTLLDDQSTMNDDGNEISTCINDNCNRFCHSIGFKHGVCDGETCICSNTQQQYDEISNIEEDNEITSNIVTGCSNDKCDGTCQGLGHAGGKCSLGKCQCNVQAGNDNSSSLKPCIVVECYLTCRSNNYIGGHCQDGRCFCV